ncbi:hypothetical protein SLEP1_g16888 [Rubroshorea leprosula]|uniref:Reverse transcriptase domain-containing protein n=1 Tax=Rubroshorea leprosula TaxID=152421 RepID=A0AAV5ISE7_9ROSI|nr:hypothetical protein SLEP1_g16888 [Rubroshorea leprosula]
MVFNGSLCGYFSGEKGVRQGHPLSPNIFVLCMEVLSRMLNKAAEEGKFAYHPKCKNVQLTHLCFAYDLMIFIDGNLAFLNAIDAVLMHFYKVSGLRAKSKLFCCGLSTSHTQLLVEKFHFKIGTLPVRYLGVPLITGKLAKKDLKPLVSKITERMSSWATKHLFFAGRLQLISSVIQGITNFWCSVFILPKGVIKEMEKICGAFLWNNETYSVKGAKVSWLHVCKFYLGCLGPGQLTQGRSFWSINIPSDASWGWRKTLKLRPLARGLIQHIPRNGQNTSLWHDNWHLAGPLLEVYGNSIVHDARIPSQAKLASVISGKRVRRKSLLSILNKLSWNATVYNIWMERNNRVHLQLFRSKSTILHEIQFEVRARKLEFAHPRSSSLPMAIAIQWGLETIVID